MGTTESSLAETEKPSSGRDSTEKTDPHGTPDYNSEIIMGTTESSLAETEKPSSGRDSTEKTDPHGTPDYNSEKKQKEIDNELGMYEYPFENIVFEGGGNKGLAYCGALEVLEEAGILKNIKRFSGASAGAIMASLVAVGYSSADIQEFMGQDMSTLFLDHSYGYFSLLPNLLRGYGWNPGNKLLSWFGEKLESKTGNADIDFLELYQRYHVELCVVVTNVNMMAVEYLHPKTTPNVPIRDAVRMSMSIPGIFQAVKRNVSGHEDTYVDGGVMCNFPVHSFDGWWLSMNKEDSYLKRLYPLDRLQRLFEKKERFGTYNEKTLGFVVYTEDEIDLLRNLLEERKGLVLPEPPATELGNIARAKKQKINEDFTRLRKEEIVYHGAVERFLNVLRRHNKTEAVDIHELRNALNDKDYTLLGFRMLEILDSSLHRKPEFTDDDRQRLFGKQVTVDEIMEELDLNKDKEIQFYELYRFIGRVGQSLRSKFLGYKRTEFSGFLSFIQAFQEALMHNVQRLFVEERDAERTVGINTGYIGTTDFKLEEGDKNYIIERGRESTKAFLTHVINTKNPHKKDGTEQHSKLAQQTATLNGNADAPTEAGERLTNGFM